MLCRILGIVTAALAACATLPASAVGQLVDVQIVDRATGETLTPIRYGNEWWVAGRPGARYRVTLVNHDGRRTLNVLSIDGINAITGDTAAWNQSGYVLASSERTDVDGWRKNLNQVAAFEFAQLPDSYAARTGRPANVGVIGIAVFEEKRIARAVTNETLREPMRESRSDGANADSAQRFVPQGSALPAPPPAPAPAVTEATPSSPLPARTTPLSEAGADKTAERAATAQRDRLGTAHGAIEDSSMTWVAFQRAQSSPNEIVTIHYDRLENLIAMGIVPQPVPPVAATDPFPDSHRYVPDPPPRIFGR